MSTRLFMFIINTIYPDIFKTVGKKLNDDKVILKIRLLIQDVKNRSHDKFSRIFERNRCTRTSLAY